MHHFHHLTFHAVITKPATHDHHMLYVRSADLRPILSTCRDIRSRGGEALVSQVWVGHDGVEDVLKAV
jgi:hypothetical protein